MKGQVEYYIRPALFHEWRLCLSYLPELLVLNSLPETLFVALPDEKSQQILGVGAVSPRLKDTTMPGFASLVRVAKNHRRQGVGTQLVRKLAAYTAQWDVPYIHGWQDYPLGVEADFLIACGFSAYLNFYGFEVPRQAAEHILNILDRYAKRSTGNDRYEFIPIALPLNPDVVSLYSQHFLLNYELANHQLSLKMQRESAQKLSASLYINNKLQGYVIGYEDHESVPKVDIWITDRGLSHTPIAMLLLCYFVKQAYDAGYERARFDCNDQALSTLKVAKRLNAKKIIHTHSFALSTNAT